MTTNEQSIATVPNGQQLDSGYRDGQGRQRAGVSEAEEAVKTLLRYIGEDPSRDGLKDTPSRVVRAWAEMTAGYWGEAPEKILSPIFHEPFDELVILRAIPFNSTCEHHLLGFSGSIDIGYIPDKAGNDLYRVVGLSKLARLVDHFSRRLSLQERLTYQIANAIDNVLHPIAVGVVARAAHQCISCRGVNKPDIECISCCLLGVFRHNPSARAEFLSLCGR